MFQKRRTTFKNIFIQHYLQYANPSKLRKKNVYDKI